MKIKLWDRIILFFGALLSAAAGLLLMIVGLQIVQMEGLSVSLPLSVRIAAIILGALCVLFCVYLLAFPRRLGRGKRDFVVQNTDNGELRIAVKAIENLVQKCIDVHEEIHVVSMHVKNGRDGVVVDLCASIANNISIPLAVASLQKQIRQYLAASSGIDVREVRVSVETAQNGAENSPYLVNGEQKSAENEEPAEKKEKKLSLHQRIFGRGEQRVTVPEPPKAEEAPAQPEENAGEQEQDALPQEESADAPLTENDQADKEDASNE